MPARTANTNQKTRDGTARVLVASGHFLVREYLRQVVESAPHLAFAGALTSLMDGARTVTTHRPDLLIVDIHSREAHGQAFVREMHERYLHLRILAVIADDDAHYCERIIHAGAQGCVTSRDGAGLVITAINQVLAGDLYLGDRLALQLARRVMGQKPGKKEQPLHSLTDREHQVLTLLGQGLRTGQIAAQLFLSRKTVDTYYARLKRKLQVPNGEALVKAAISWVRHSEQPFSLRSKPEPSARQLPDRRILSH